METTQCLNMYGGEPSPRQQGMCRMRWNDSNYLEGNRAMFSGRAVFVSQHDTVPHVWDCEPTNGRTCFVEASNGVALAGAEEVASRGAAINVQSCSSHQSREGRVVVAAEEHFCLSAQVLNQYGGGVPYFDTDVMLEVEPADPKVGLRATLKKLPATLGTRGLTVPLRPNTSTLNDITNITVYGKPGEAIFSTSGHGITYLLSLMQ